MLFGGRHSSANYSEGDSLMIARRQPRTTGSASVARRRLRVLFEHERHSISKTDIFNGDGAMETVKHDKAVPAISARTVEADRREIAHPKAPSAVDADGLFGDVLEAGGRSIAEIEKLIGELHTARDYLQGEGERLRREAAKYAHLTKCALSSVRTISESMGKWRETEVPSRNLPARGESSSS
jgi:hypothetical protein